MDRVYFFVYIDNHFKLYLIYNLQRRHIFDRWDTFALILGFSV